MAWPVNTIASDFFFRSILPHSVFSFPPGVGIMIGSEKEGRGIGLVLLQEVDPNVLAQVQRGYFLFLYNSSWDLTF